MSSIKVKTFALALSKFHGNSKQMEKYLRDQRLTLAEKAILKAWFNLEDNKFQKILETIPKLHTTDEVVESQKHLIWGLALNNSGEFTEAKKHLEASIPALVKFSLHSHLFTVHTNLLILHYNLNAPETMKNHLDALQGIPHETRLAKLVLLQSAFLYYSKSKQLPEATAALEELDSEFHHLSDPMRVLHLITKFDFFVAQENFEACAKTLAQLRRLKKFAFSANYRFMKTMLNNLKDNAPIYVYERDFPDHPFLFQQIMVIKCLEENKQSEAEEYWYLLKASCPDLFGDAFEFKGSKSLFSLALDKMKKSVQQTIPVVFNLEKSKELVVLEVLQGAEYPISKEKLFEILWKEAPDKSTLNRLQKIISRLRESGHPIQYQKGCYFIQKNLKKTA